MDDFTAIDIKLIDKPKTLLRPVRRHTVEYHELMDSIQQFGFVQTILVRPIGNGRYEVVDGFWRYSVAMDIGLTQIPCIVQEMSDVDVLGAQLRMNAIRPHTNRMEFARQLLRMQNDDPSKTLTDLALTCCKSEVWVKQQLSLNRIQKKYQSLVESGDICLLNAYSLAKLPHKLQDELVEDAINMPSTEFRRYVAGHIQQVMVAVREKKLRETYVEEFKLVPFLRTVKEVHREYEEPAAGPANLAIENAKTPLDGWLLALKWAMNLDQEGAEIQRAKAERRLQKRISKEPDTDQ